MRSSRISRRIPSRLVLLVATSVPAIALLSGCATDASSGQVDGSAGASTAALPELNLTQAELTPLGIHEAINKFNAVYDACMSQNGAERAPIQPSGWSYDDPGYAATRACATLDTEMQSWLNSTEVMAVKRTPAFTAFVKCMAPIQETRAPASEYSSSEKAEAKKCADAAADGG